MYNLLPNFHSRSFNGLVKDLQDVYHGLRFKLSLAPYSDEIGDM